MKASFYHIVYGVSVGILLALAACNQDSIRDIHDNSRESEAMFAISFKMPETRESGDGGSGGNGYEEGICYENYIEMIDNNYRIYFFDPGSNKFIAELHQTTGTSFGTSEYRITGTVPEEVCRHNRLSVMVVANWMRYGNLIPGHNHIDDVINAEWAQFDILDKFELDPARGRLMPFYGFGTYDNVTFRKGEVTRLDEPVALLRAMAKVEVVLDMPAVDDVKVEICGYNAKGCCTPVFSEHDNYDHRNWDEDYTRELHLAGGKNDSDATSNRKELQRIDDGTGKPKWIAYLPEYCNSHNTNAAYIEVRFGSNPPYRIDFAEYENGRKLEDSQMNIYRNNLYRYTGILKDNAVIVFSVTVDPFEVLPDEDVELNE